MLSSPPFGISSGMSTTNFPNIYSEGKWKIDLANDNSVESQGRTLEELEYLYQQPNPVKASKRRDKVVVQEDGHVTEKISENDV